MENKTIKFIILIFASILITLACKKDRNCEDAKANYDTSNTKFKANPTVKNCETYKIELQAIVNECLVAFEPNERSEILEIIYTIEKDTCKNYIKKF